MFLQLIIPLLLGILAGIITGLIPGIHVNLICTLLATGPPLPYAIFIVSLATTHSFLDTIPSIYLGAPDSDTALLPTHRLLKEGEGHLAMKLTIIGSLFSLLLCLAIFPLTLIIIPKLYELTRPILGYLLLATCCFLIVREKSKLAPLVFTLAAILGYLSLNSSSPNPLFPLLSGLFGTSALLYSLKDNTTIPPQKNTAINLPKSTTIRAILSATIAGFFTSLLPGLGSAHGAILALIFNKNLGNLGFLLLIGGINTVNFTLSLATLYTLGKARNGAVIAISNLLQIQIDHIIILGLTALVAGAVATAIAIPISLTTQKLLTKIPYKKVTIAVILLLVTITYPLSGAIGMLILLTSTAIGILPLTANTSRSLTMSCLLVPTTLFFLL